jgi:hypothetical protein
MMVWQSLPSCTGRVLGTVLSQLLPPAHGYVISLFSTSGICSPYALAKYIVDGKPSYDSGLPSLR